MKCNLLGLNHATGLMLSATPGAKNGIDLIDKYNSRLEFAGKREYCPY